MGPSRFLYARRQQNLCATGMAHKLRSNAPKAVASATFASRERGGRGRFWFLLARQKEPAGGTSAVTFRQSGRSIKDEGAARLRCLRQHRSLPLRGANYRSCSATPMLGWLCHPRPCQTRPRSSRPTKGLSLSQKLPQHHPRRLLHPKPPIKPLQLGIAGQINVGDALQFAQNLLHQRPADAPALIGGQHL